MNATAATTAIEVIAEAGFAPSDDIDHMSWPADTSFHTLDWAAKRFDALRPESFGFTGITIRDGEITVVAMTEVGVIWTDVRFRDDRLGLVMLAAALEALN